MNFTYKEFGTVTISGMRFYETPEGNFYPSITTVLGNTIPQEKAEALKNWQKSLGVSAAQAKTQEAADRGTVVHLLAERYLKKEQLIQDGEKFKQQDINSFNSLKLKLNKIESVWCQEVPLYSDSIGVAGRTDCIGIYKGVPSIIDFKTSSKLKGDAQITDYKLQLAAYALMHNEMFGTDITQGIILMTSDGGFPQEFVIDLPPQEIELKARTNKYYATLESKLQ